LYLFQLEVYSNYLRRRVTQKRFIDRSTRWRTYLTSDIERECDFMIFNDGFGTFEDLMEHWWMIYTMTDKYVYFVRIPADQILSIGSVDRLAEFYHTAADRLARMDSSAFKNAVSSTIPPSKGLLDYLTAAAFFGTCV
uniref:AAA_8 domain-containing protein n=1 Tax=Angiostrongylus cantonensis TaxID=6313 RepID=A0A0K0DR64_ANGCA